MPRRRLGDHKGIHDHVVAACRSPEPVHLKIIDVSTTAGLDGVLGTTAAKIVNHWAVSVLVVKANP